MFAWCPLPPLEVCKVRIDKDLGPDFGFWLDKRKRLRRSSPRSLSFFTFYFHYTRLERVNAQSIFRGMLLISGWLWCAMGDGGIDMRFLPVFREFIFWGGVSVGDAGVVGEAQA